MARQVDCGGTLAVLDLDVTSGCGEAGGLWWDAWIVEWTSSWLSRESDKNGSLQTCDDRCGHGPVDPEFFPAHAGRTMVRKTRHSGAKDFGDHSSTATETGLGSSCGRNNLR